MTEDDNTPSLLKASEVINSSLVTAKKEWSAIYNNESLKNADIIISKSPREYIDADAADIEEAKAHLENYAFHIQREYNKIVAKESDAEDSFNNAMVYYSLNIKDAKTEKEKEKRALADNINLITLQEVYSIRRKSRMFLEKMVERIEAYVNVLKKIHDRKFLRGTKSD